MIASSGSESEAEEGAWFLPFVNWSFFFSETVVLSSFPDFAGLRVPLA